MKEVLPDFLGSLGAALVLAGGDWIAKRASFRSDADSPTSDESGDENDPA